MKLLLLGCFLLGRCRIGRHDRGRQRCGGRLLHAVELLQHLLVPRVGYLLYANTRSAPRAGNLRALTQARTLCCELVIDLADLVVQLSNRSERRVDRATQAPHESAR